MQELWILHSACCLILTDISTKFGLDSWNGFQVIEDMILWQSPRE